MISNHRLALFCTMVFCLATGPALAQAMSTSMMSSEPTQKVIAENDKVQVTDVVDKPGDVSPSTVRQGWVVHWITGGKLERTYADGKKEVLNRKGGETTLITEKRAYSVKNIGTTNVHLIEIKVK